MALPLGQGAIQSGKGVLMPLGAAVSEQGGHAAAHQPLGDHGLRLHVRHGQAQRQRRLVPPAGGCAVNLRPVVLGDLAGGGQVLHRVPGPTLPRCTCRCPELRGDVGVVVLQPHAVGASLCHDLMDLVQRAAVIILLLRKDGGEAVPNCLGIAGGEAQIVLQKPGVAVDHPGLPSLIDLLQLGTLGGQLVAGVVALQLVQSRHIAGGHIVQPILQLFRRGGLERFHFMAQAVPVHSAVQTVLPQGIYVGRQFRIGGRHGIGALPHTILHLLDAGGVKDVEVKVLLPPQALRRVPDREVLTVALPGGFINVFQRSKAADVHAAGRTLAGGAHRGTGVAAQARLGCAGGDLVGDVGDVS